MFLYFPHCCTPSDIEPLAPLANPPMIAPIVVARAPPCLPIIAPSMAPTVASPASAKTMSSSPLSSHSSVTVSQMSSQVSPIEFPPTFFHGWRNQFSVFNSESVKFLIII